MRLPSSTVNQKACESLSGCFRLMLPAPRLRGGGIGSVAPLSPVASLCAVDLGCRLAPEGEKPVDLPVMRATKFEIVINTQTAKTLAIDLPPGVFDFVEEPLNKISLAIEREIAIPLHLAVGFWRDHRSDGSLIECVDQRIGVVSLVADERTRIGIFEQRLRASQVMDLPWRQHQVTGITQGIDERVDFGGQSSARSADRLRAVFFRAPALC